MTKEQFLAHVAKLYRIGNLSDSDSEEREEWTKPEMAGIACCASLDVMIRKMVEFGVITKEERQKFYDDLI